MATVEVFFNGALVNDFMRGRSLVLLCTDDYPSLVGKELQVSDIDTCDPQAPVEVNEGDWIGPDDEFTWLLEAGDEIRIISSKGVLRTLSGEIVTVITAEGCMLHLEGPSGPLPGRYNVDNLKFEWVDLAQNQEESK